MSPDAIERFVAESTAGAVVSPEHTAVIRALVTRALSLAQYESNLGDLRGAVTALEELLDGSRLFHPWRDTPKATIFGSARTSPDSELYRLASALSAELADQGWLTVTGAGPGIMEASSRGAGRDNSIGVNIELPFEHGTNAYVDVENRHIATSFFFTRKVIMTRSSQAFVAFPGGVGTMDELFEILTLLHTGKTDPVPVVLVDRAGGTFWNAWAQFMSREVVAQGYLSRGDEATYRLCDNVEDAVREITTFYANYRSCVTADGEAMVNVRVAPNDEEFARLGARFAEISFTVDSGALGTTLAFAFNGRSYATLRRVIDEVNTWRGQSRS
ncbi:MAG: TIGR00730 family Rossman fold protein [Acidobacteria bacterium]|nr:TIGR00730 family Rossman fold protein [Acidobacteriota bacterium]